MDKSRLRFLFFALAVLFLGSCTRGARAQGVANVYPRMAPIEQYLMTHDAEIAMARSAAPAAISDDASVLVLGRRGYETAVKGKNGWTCIVDRGWSGMLDHPDFWNPKIRAASCLNPAATRSILSYDILRTELVLRGLSKEEIITATAAAIARKELPVLEPGAMCFMMSKTDYLFDQGDHTMSHVMFYTADDGTSWGANLTNSPIMGVSFWSASRDSYPQLKTFPLIFVSLIAADKWSDGTPVMKM